ncbi:transmembrane protein 17A isoform X2 [Phyllopteryx taeniolatus]|uniref:transmembrane protein 17A isoform X2 n=1 Tax=Phyllopteryx taeniolatus TaxID=161469 RepID=UPI002AD2E49D|nr:transmembrane protein 17A isoform X2 [Phyllopteryx taeniolatus]
MTVSANGCLFLCALRLAGNQFRVYPDSCPMTAGMGSSTPATLFAYLPGYYQGLLIAGIVLITLGELLRLYLGYFGNLEENVPALSSFCVLTFLFQLPVLLFLLTDEDAVVLPLERAVHLLFVGTLLAQSLAAGLAVRRMSRKLTLLFHLGQLAKVRPRFGHAGLAAYRRAVAPARARATCR